MNQIKKSILNNERLSNLETVESFEKKEKRNKKKLQLTDFSERKNEALRNQKVKSLIGLMKNIRVVLNHLLLNKA